MLIVHFVKESYQNTMGGEMGLLHIVQKYVQK